jgi:sulfane dehydrogenase subunit SoxC
VVVPRWGAVASVKWLGRIHVSEGPLFSPWNTEKYVLMGGTFGERRNPLTVQIVKSALELPWPAWLPGGNHVIRGRSWSPHAAISRVEYSVNGEPWRPARLLEPNISGAWVRWSFAWRGVRPGDY